jgi:Flp pilus assembly protein TadG
MRRSHRRAKGVAAVELALLRPVLMAVLLGIMEWGWLFMQQFSVVNAVREGTRIGVTVPPSAVPDPATAAIAAAKLALINEHVPNAGTATVTAAIAAQPGPPAFNALTVTVKVPYTPLIGYVPTVSSLHYTMTMMMEQQN